MLSVDIKHSMRDLICDIMNYCASSFVIGKIKCIWLNRNEQPEKEN